MNCSSRVMTNVFPLTVFVFLALANVLTVLCPFVGVPISKEFADWCFWWSTILSAPGQIALVLGSTTFLVDGHRRQRMGISGVLHAVFNMIALPLARCGNLEESWGYLMTYKVERFCSYFGFPDICR